MFFKTLEIQGFKSFADRTVLDFDTKTTAVVGSNGNGKSNISDALRWVMGEQGAKTLRGEKMEDVIFHGTVERKPMGFAKVVLTIDNTDRTLDINADEVVISRKLYRSGDSEYLINGQRSRLKDIQELLMDTGLGRDGYSIIGQGRVAEIVNARDTKRREIFEEAAGVSLFLHKKSEAEKQLAAAEENILRQKDIIRLDEERLPILKKQSEKAALASELLAQKKELEIGVSVARLGENKEALRKLDDEILLNTGESENYEHDIEKAQSEIERLAENRLSTQGLLERTRSGIQSANEALAEKRAEIQVAENDISHNAKRRSELAEQLKDAESSGKGFDDKIAELNARIAEKQQLSRQFEEEIQALNSELDEISRGRELQGEAFSALESELAGAYREKSEAEIAASQARLAAEEAEEQKQTFLAELADSEHSIEAHQEELAEAKKTLQGIISERETDKNRLAGLERLYEGKRARREKAKEALDAINAKLSEKQQRHRLLSDIERNKEGYSRAVKEIITAGEQGRITGIHGIVADVVTVEEKYIIAIETVLQPVMQNIIVDNEETAGRCIRFLKDANVGRATFYPLTSMRGRHLNEPRLDSEQGFEGIASELVECDDEYAEILANLLGTTAVVDDIDTASRIGKKYGYKFRIVTLDGQLVNAGGSFTGGSRVSRGGIISRKQEVDALFKEINALREECRVKTDEFERARAEVNKSSIELEGVGDRLRALDAEEIRASAEISRLESLIEQLDRQSAVSKQTLAGFDARIERQNALIAENTSAAQRLSERIAELEQKHSEQESGRREIDEHIRSLSERISGLNLSKLSALKDADALGVEVRGTEERRKALLESSGDYKQAMDKLDQSDREIREKIERLKREIENETGNISDKNDEITRLSDEITALERQINQLHASINEAAASKEKFSREIARLEERRESVRREYDKVVHLLFDSYELTVSQATEIAAPPEDLTAATNELGDLNKRISALGMVNMESIEEYRKVSERYEFQTSQLRDIENSKRELEKLIDDLTADIKTRFLHSFQDINSHFKEIFTRIFGEGARAELELTRPDDVLNSGIEIKAAPPGKVIKNLISLSGGEQTMVAITIYFAILMHRPTPFCMLDEVDAALDDVNVEKYISYLKQFSSQTQLMVITHRRGTIEGCDVLYGVFMQEKGVSRLLRQELTEELEAELD